MSTSTPFSTYEQWLKSCTQTTGGSANAFWQGHTAYWETFGSIMQQRIATFATLWNTTPEWQAQLAQCTNFPDFCETYSRWYGETFSKTSILTADVLAQRAWLWQQWKALAGRAGMPGINTNQISGSTTSTTPTGPSGTSTSNRSTTQQTPQSAATTKPAPAQAQKQQENQLSLLTTNTIMLAPKQESTATVTPLRPATATPLKVSRTAASASRSSAQAASIASSSSPRRSVVASRRSRARVRVVH